MGNDDGWLDQVRGRGRRAPASRVWPLPLPDDYRKPARLARSPTSRTSAPAATAARSPPALFLQEFVGDASRGCTSTSPARPTPSETDGEIVKGGTGFGVRTLVELASGFTKPKRAEA